MGVTKLQHFAGEAEILGEIQHFNYDGSNEVLVLHGVADTEKALALLDRLSLGTLAVQRPKEILRVPKPARAEPPAGATAPSAVSQQYNGDPVAEPQPAQVEEKAVEGVVVEVGGPDVSGPFPAAVLAATRMRPVVEFFHDQKGLKSVEEITAACEAARSQIPILGNVKDMRDRVERTLSAYFKTPDATPA